MITNFTMLGCFVPLAQLMVSRVDQKLLASKDGSLKPICGFKLVLMITI